MPPSPSPGAFAPTSPHGRGSQAGLFLDAGLCEIATASTGPFKVCYFAKRVVGSLSQGERAGLRGIELSWIRTPRPSPGASAPTSPHGRGSQAGVIVTDLPLHIPDTHSFRLPRAGIV